MAFDTRPAVRIGEEVAQSLSETMQQECSKLLEQTSNVCGFETTPAHASETQEAPSHVVDVPRRQRSFESFSVERYRATAKSPINWRSLSVSRALVNARPGRAFSVLSCAVSLLEFPMAVPPELGFVPGKKTLFF